MTARTFIVLVLTGIIECKFGIIASVCAAPIHSQDFVGLPNPHDPLERLYGRKQLFYERGSPIVTVMLLEGQKSISFVPQKRMRLLVNTPKKTVIEAPKGSHWTVRLSNFTPGKTTWSVLVGETPYASTTELLELRTLWKRRGYPVRSQVFGSLYGIAGRVLDTRRHFVLVGEFTESEMEAKKLLSQIEKKYGGGASLVSTLSQRPHGKLELVDSAGRVHATGNDFVQATCLEENPGDRGSFLVKSVKIGVDTAWEGFNDQIYRGSLFLVVDRYGGITAVNSLPLESYVRGIVASEIFASAPMEALKAQSVAARGQVLAKLGTRHLADPYLLCSQQHCQVYSGVSGEHPATNAAVKATFGQVLFAPRGGPLVDTVYSAVCGGHTENNEVAWGGSPNPSLRGRSDLVHTPKAFARGISSQNLNSFLASKSPAYCSIASLANAKKYRWIKEFSQTQINNIARPLGTGPVKEIRVEKRGISGRVNWITLVGKKSAAQVHGELKIRRLFSNLNSSSFRIIPPQTSQPPNHQSGWVFEGAGWGHGVGMCQMGAIGRAESGQGYLEILRHYYNGAEVVRMY